MNATAPLRALFPRPEDVDSWLARWARRLADEPGTPEARAAAMRAVSPVTIARNHRVEEALAAAATGDEAPFRTLLAALASPYEARAAWAHLAEPAPADVTAAYQTFCGT